MLVCMPLGPCVSTKLVVAGVSCHAAPREKKKPATSADSSNINDKKREDLPTPFLTGISFPASRHQPCSHLVTCERRMFRSLRRSLTGAPQTLSQVFYFIFFNLTADSDEICALLPYLLTAWTIFLPSIGVKDISLRR